MTQRQEALLASVINEYILTAQPVSSKFLEETGFFGLKSATIRLEMNNLEDVGYLAQLHTSGGRVPTDKAYRYYVDNLVSPKHIEPNSGAKRKIKKAIASVGNDPRVINKTIAQVLSDISDNLVITNIVEGEDFFKIGLSSLFEMPEFREFDKVFKLTSFFDEFENVFSQLANRIFSEMDIAEDIKIFIGCENPVKNVRDETIMFAKYNLPHNYTGSLTLVGPTRMDYGKNIGLVRYTTQELNKLARRT